MADDKIDAGSSTEPAKGDQPSGISRTTSSPDGENAGMSDAPRDTPAVTAQARTGSGLGWSALALGVLALAAAGYAWYQGTVNARLIIDEQDNRVGVLEQRLEEVADAQAGVDGLVEQVHQQLADHRAEVADQVAQLRLLADGSGSALQGEVSEISQQQIAAEGRLSEQIRAVRAEAEAGRTQVETGLAETAAGLTARQDGLRREFDALATSVEALHRGISGGVERWNLRQAEQLLLIANQRALLGGDAQGALAALELADQQLYRLADPSLLPVREALSAEIAALEGTEPPDLAGIIHALSVLANTLEELPMHDVTPQAGPSAPEQSDTPVEDENQAAETSTGDRILDIGRAFLADLGDLVQVEKDGEPLVPSLSPDFRRIIVERGKLLLEGAQVAVMRQEPGIYLERLEAAEQWVRERHDDSKDRTLHWLGKLSELKDINPKTEIPDISASLDLLRDLMSKES